MSLMKPQVQRIFPPNAMAKDKKAAKVGKSAPTSSADSHAAKSKVLNGVKEGRVNKSGELPKSTSKKVAANTAAKMNGADKKSKKALPPKDISSDEGDDSDVSASDSDASSASSAATSDSDVGPDSDSESEAAPKEPKKPQANGTSKLPNGKPSKGHKASKEVSTSSEESDSESDSSSEASDAEEEVKASKPRSVQKGKAAESSDESEGDNESDDESDESNADGAEGKPTKAGQTPQAGNVRNSKAAGASDPESGSDSDVSEDEPGDKKQAAKGADESSAGSSEGSVSEADSESSEDAPSKKRKAEAEDSPAAKKAKTEGAADSNASKTLFVGNLSWNVDDEWLSREFQPFKAVSTRLMYQKDSGRSKGFGFVDFENIEDAIKAHEAKKGQDLDGRPMNVDFTGQKTDASPAQRQERRGQQYGDSKSAPTNNLFIGNLSFDITAEVLQDTFGEFGTVTRVSIPTDRESGVVKGFGYVEFSSTDEAKAALEGMTGQSIMDRPVRLDYSGGRASDGPGNFRGRGGDRGGRGGFRGDRGGRGFGGRGFGGGRGDRGGRGGGGRGRGRGFNTTNRGRRLRINLPVRLHR